MNLWALLVSIMSSLSVPGCSAQKCDVQVTKEHNQTQVVVLMSTDRPDSQTSHVAENLVHAYEQTGLKVELYRVTDFGPEFYEPTAYAQKPEQFNRFNEAVRAAVLVVLVTPEYNATIPGPLTRVINLLSYPDSFDSKKYAIVSLSLSPYAAVRAHEGLKKVLQDLHADVQDALNLKVAEVQNATKGSTIYTEHAEKVAEILQK